MHDRGLRWGSWIVLAIGLLIVAGGIAIGQGSLRLLLYGARAEAEVIEIRRRADMYAPILRFRTHAGEPREVEALGSGSPDFAVGDTVMIYYWPDDPETFRLGTFERLWFNTIFLLGFGGIWLLFGGVIFAISRGGSLAAAGETAFAAIAAGGFILFLIVGWNAAALYLEGERADGTVVGQRESRSVSERDGRRVVTTMYAPIVRFTTRAGREIEFHARGGEANRYKAGDKVAVLYDPSNPINARILTFVDLWLPTFVAACVFAFFGGAVWLSRRFRLREAT